MRSTVYVLVAAIGLVVSQAPVEANGDAAAFWKSVQRACDATAAKPARELGRRIAQTAIDEFGRFGGHRIDSTGRLFHFGRTEAEHRMDDGSGGEGRLGHLAWWQVMKYWRAVYGDAIADKLEVRGYRDASTSADEALATALLRADAAGLLRAAESVADPQAREILREAAVRAAIVDTPWSAAFVSYVVRQSGVAPDAFRFSNAHRDYIYDAFAASAAELDGAADDRIYRACPLAATRPRVGDLICQQREPGLADASEAAVRERIRSELAGGPNLRTVRRTHCEVVAHIDATARKLYTVGGNVNQSVSARKLNLRRNDLKFSSVQRGRCGGAGHWTLPQGANEDASTNAGARKCSLNDRNWFVLLQLR